MIQPEGQLPRAVLFDMDGTLTRPMLDFPRIKREMGIGTESILEAMQKMSAHERAVANAILERHEEEAARNSTLNPGCHELLGWIRERSIPTALITRNSPASVRTVLELHRLEFDAIYSRDDAPPKPDPAALHGACQQFKLPAGRAWMVGDGEFDIAAGCAAGMATVWISHGRTRHFPHVPWKEAADLWEVLSLLKICAAEPPGAASV